MHIRSQIFLALAAIQLLVSSGCKKDEKSNPGITGNQPFATGVFITNEGQYPSGAGSVSFFNRTNGLVQNDIYNIVNGIPLGSVVQSMEVYDSLAYIVVNNSARIEVVNASTFKSIGTITGLNSPRYFLGISGTKGYVSDWQNTVAVINLGNFSVSKTIPTGSGPGKMLLAGDYVYVINDGAWGIDSTVTVIDILNDQVFATIQVGKRPTGIVQDADGSIWVMCSGKGFNKWPAPGDSEGHLIKINPLSHAIEKDIAFPDNIRHPERLAINGNGDMLYFLYSGGIYQMNIFSDIYQYNPLVANGNFYNMGFDPVSNMIFATDALDFQQDGYVYRFKASGGAKIDSVKVDVGPGEFCFR